MSAHKKIQRTIEIARAMMPEKRSGRSFHVTAAFRKSKMVAIAFNDYQQHHLSHVFGPYKPTRGGKNYRPCRHSEAEVCRKLKCETDDLTFVNVRLGVDGQPMLSRPCQNCHDLLRRKKFKKLLYTVSDMEYSIIV